MKLNTTNQRLSLLLGLFLFIAVQTTLCRAQHLMQQSHLARIQTAVDLNKAIPNLLDSAGIPGMAISVIKDGKIAFAEAYGIKSTETKEKTAINTVFEAASLSKTVFAYA